MRLLASLGCEGLHNPLTKGDTMNRKHCLSVLGIVLFAACALFAQESFAQEKGNLASIEFQKVKHQNVAQYEAGRKQKAAWHKQQNDPLPLFVWQILSGDNTGTFVVGHFGQHWADYDKPVVTDEADIAEFEKVIGANVESVVTRYYEYLPKISNQIDANSNMAPPFSEIITFHVRSGKESEFRSAITRVYDATVKSKWPVNYGWYVLVNGGEGGTFVLSLPRKSWADFDDKPDVKPFRDMVKEAFGQAEADSIEDRFNRSIESSTSEIIKFRADLSYLPAK
jgi:hypothetical protein